MSDTKKTIRSFLLVITCSFLLVSCGKEQDQSGDDTQPWNARAESVTPKQAEQKIPNFSLPEKTDPLKITRRNEGDAIVITAYYRYGGTIEAASPTFTDSGLETISENGEEALYQRVERAQNNRGGRNQLQVRIETYEPSANLHFEQENIQSVVGQSLEKGTRLIQVIYRQRVQQAG